ncbi:uncharacterized protein V6R79_013739 [Siganus canaliculatus]
MTTERPKWWKAFLPKKKTGVTKDVDFDPFAPESGNQKEDAAAPKPTSDQSSLSKQDSPRESVEANNSSSIPSDDTYDDSHLESVFNEQTCRRNMKVSRSGRFKEKRRGRSSLPIQDREGGNGPSGKEDVR